jgi:hypothetical protein
MKPIDAVPSSPLVLNGEGVAILLASPHYVLEPRHACHVRSTDIRLYPSGRACRGERSGRARHHGAEARGLPRVVHSSPSSDGDGETVHLPKSGRPATIVGDDGEVQCGTVEQEGRDADRRRSAQIDSRGVGRDALPCRGRCSCLIPGLPARGRFFEASCAASGREGPHAAELETPGPRVTISVRAYDELHATSGPCGSDVGCVVTKGSAEPTRSRCARKPGPGRRR